MSTSEVNAPIKETVADPAVVEPTTMASEASKDPIRPSGTDALVPESRPEVTNGTEGAATVPTAGAPATEPTGEKTAPKGSTVVESQPVNEGILNYKGPGLVKSLIFSKKFFWFSNEPVEHKHLSTYLGNEKSDIGHRNAAHATQTGKGLLLYAKRAEDKGHPAGILNLGEMTDFAKGDFNDFTFKLHGHKHTFQAPSRAERDGWLVAIDTRSSAAKEAHEGVIGSDGYKNQLEKFANPTGAATTTGASRSASRPKKTTEPKPVASTTTDPKLTESKASEPKAAETAAGTVGGAAGNGSSSDEAKPKLKSKSRSQSRKRSSIFGTLLGKKEEHDDKKELKKEDKEEKAERKVEEQAIKHDVKKEDKAERKAEKEELKLEQKEGTSTAGNMDAAAIAARVVGAPLATEGETATTTTTTGTTTGTTGMTGATGTTGTTGTTGLTAGTTGETPLVSGTEPSAVTPSRETAPKASKRGSIFGNFFNKKETSSPIAAETAPAVPAKDSEAAANSSVAPQLEDPVSSPAGGATATANEPSAAGSNGVTLPIASPATPDANKPQRRTSFFNNLGTKKEKRSEGLSDAEGTDGETKKSTGSKLGGLFRKPSRATPAATAKSEPTAPTSALVDESTKVPDPLIKEEPTTINGNEVVPETATKTEAQQQPIQASA